MTTKVLTAHIPLPLAEKVVQMAVRLERSRGWIVKQALAACHAGAAREIGAIDGCR